MGDEAKPKPNPSAKPPEKSAKDTPARQPAEPKQTRVVAQWKYTHPMIACRVDPTGKYVLGCSEDRSIQRFTVADGKRVALLGHTSWVRGLACTPDGKTLISGGYDGKLIWWPLTDDTPKPKRTVEKAHTGWVREVAISPDGSRIATAGNDNLVKVWQVTDGASVAQFEGHTSHVYGVTFDPSGEHVVSGDLHGHIKQWHIADGKHVRDLEAPAMTGYDKTFRAQYGGVRHMSFSPNGTHLVCAGLHKSTNAFAGKNEPVVVRFEWATGKIAATHATPGVQGIAWGAAEHADGFVVAGCGGGSGGYLVFWKPNEAKPFHKVKLRDTVRGFDIHPDGLRLATAHYDRHVRLSIMAPKPK